MFSLRGFLLLVVALSSSLSKANESKKAFRKIAKQTVSQSLKKVDLVQKEWRRSGGNIAKLLRTQAFEDVQEDDRDYLVSSILKFGLAPSQSQGTALIIQSANGPISIDFSRLSQSLVWVNGETFELPIEESLEVLEKEYLLPELRRRILGEKKPGFSLWDLLFPSASAFVSSCSEEQKSSAINTAKTGFAMARTGLGIAGCFDPNAAALSLGITCVGIACRTVSKCREGHSIGSALKDAVGLTEWQKKMDEFYSGEASLGEIHNSK